MPLKIRAVGQHAHWIIHELQSIRRALSNHAGPVLVCQDPVQGRHRIGNAVLLPHNPNGVKHGGCLPYGRTEPQQEADQLNGCNGRSWIFRDIPGSTVIVLRITGKIKDSCRKTHLIDAVRENHGGKILGSAYETVAAADSVGSCQVVPFITSWRYVKFWVKGIGKVHGTAKTGIALGSPYGDCGTHLHPSLFG